MFRLADSSDWRHDAGTRRPTMSNKTKTKTKTKTAPKAQVEKKATKPLSDDELNQVSGGTGTSVTSFQFGTPIKVEKIDA
jgi:bacteriocin-like protein